MIFNRGYALIETLLASMILASGIVGVASVFSISTGAGIRNQQRASATQLLYDKMEQLRNTGTLPIGGSLNPLQPVNGFTEEIITSNSQAPFLRLWQVQGAAPQTITVAVFGRLGAKPPFELSRATGSW